MSKLSPTHFAVRSARFFSRSHFALALGIAAAVAVIVGALIVGDCVRRSLQGLVLDRLGNIEAVMHSRTFVSTETLQQMTVGENQEIVPAVILSRSTVESRKGTRLTVASNVQVIAADSQFWSASPEKLSIDLGFDEIAINASLASELQVSQGDELTLRLSKTPGAPADNPLGRKDDTLVSLPRQRIASILPDDSIAGVSFVVGQSAPRNIFCSLETVQETLECGTSVNAAVVASTDAAKHPNALTQELCDDLNLQLQPSLEGYGLKLDRHRMTVNGQWLAPNDEQEEELLLDYFQLSADELVIDDATLFAVYEKVGGSLATPTLTYLANTVEKINPTKEDLSPRRSAYSYEQARERARRGEPAMVFGMTGVLAAEIGDFRSQVSFGEAVRERQQGQTDQPLSRKVPYSILVGVDLDNQDVLGLTEFRQVDIRELQLPYVWVNEWLADEIDVKPGDWVKLSYFEPETADGQAIERDTNFMIAGIVPITKPSVPYRRTRQAKFDDAPTQFNDPNLTPSVPGVTDQDSISKWDLPFSIDEDLILPVDDEYWNLYRLTPKLYAPLDIVSRRQYFGSRFGRATAIRFEAASVNSEAELREQIEDSLLETRSEKGLAFIPVRFQQLQAASGATPFDALFLSLSFFVIIAALLLVTLLLKLGIQNRGSQLGVLYANGYTQGRVRSILLIEYAVVTAVGCVIGVVLGIGYARLMIAGLQTWWVGAITTPFLRFSFGPIPVIGGAIAGFLVCMLVIYFVVRRLSRQTPLDLLRGNVDRPVTRKRTDKKWLLGAAGLSATCAIGLLLAAFGQSGMARAGLFFGCGFFVLAASLLVVHFLLSQHGRTQASQGVLGLAWKATCRNPVRSSLALGLLAVASFLITSMGVFQVSPSRLGYGGFDLLGESSQPIYRNLASASVRQEMLGPEASKLMGASVIPMRMLPGEDASCNNLFQSTRPTVLGVPSQLSDLTDLSPETSKFAWAAASNPKNPWVSLFSPQSGTADAPIPVILDQNTAAWSLKKGARIDATFSIEFDSQTLHFKTVGLLANSVLQGKLLIAGQNFERVFPEVSGYRYFLIRSGNDAGQAAETFEKGWSEAGLDITFSETVLKELLGVQNTYISAFQTLGALGLLLGTFGLAAVQLRSVTERQRELALMQAVGFSKQRIVKMLNYETALVLGAGLVVGVLSAVIAILPYAIETGPNLSYAKTLGSLLLVLITGFAASLFALRRATKTTVLDGLRSE